jgi:hypothetical protein
MPKQNEQTERLDRAGLNTNWEDLESENQEKMSLARGLDLEKKSKNADAPQNDHKEDKNGKVLVKKRETIRGKSMPVLRRRRSSSKDKDGQSPTPEDMGLAENDEFLLTRKVSAVDLRRHQDVNVKGFLGANFRRPRDFIKMFGRGLSSAEAPKLDLSYNVEANPNLKKQLISEQALCNLHSRVAREAAFAEQILKELGFSKEQIEAFEKDEQAFRDEETVEEVTEVLENNDNALS